MYEIKIPQGALKDKMTFVLFDKEHACNGDHSSHAQYGNRH